MKTNRKWLIIAGFCLVAAALFLAGHARAQTIQSHLYLPVVAAPPPPVGRIAFERLDLFNWNNTIDIMDSDGSNLTQVISNTFAAYDWSPDGSKLAFTSNYEIYTVDQYGNGLTNLTHNPEGYDSYPSWSPDGAYISFLSIRGDDTAISVYKMKADGTGVTRLFGSSDMAWPVLWSPDGSKIAFGVNKINPSYSASQVIYSIYPDGTNLTQLTFNSGYDIIPLLWSPDGVRLLVETNTYPYSRNYNLSIMNADGNNLHALSTEGDLQTAAWVKGGTKIVYSALNHTYLLDPDGGEKKELTCNGNPIYASGLDWEPAGNRIAFTLVRLVGVPDTSYLGGFVLNLGTNSCVRIAPAGPIYENALWRP